MEISLDRWKALSTAQREESARQIASHLPTGFAFDSIECFSPATGDVAFFTFGTARFALIPGGVFNLGFDPERQWHPTDEELQSWQYTAEEYGLSGSIHDHIVRSTLRRRRVELRSFLIETVAHELGWTNVSANDREIQSLIQKYKNTKQLTVCTGETTTRIQRKADGSIIAERSLRCTHAELADQFKASGFRFPSCDEWEFVCGCAEPTLFRWGDHAPCDRYPIDVKESNQWDLHVKPNAFGVTIASNPYRIELVAEIGTTRGGDGGCSICGGYGFFVGWLPLATAYFEEYFCKHDPNEPISAGYTIGRRVLDLE